MLEATEQRRLTRLYENLRLRLLDLSKRNQLLNYSLNSRSKRFLQLVDCSLELVHRHLTDDEASVRIAALPEPDEIPEEERTDEFRATLDRARGIDIEYLIAIEAMEVAGRDDEAEMAKLERQLRERVREELGLPPRPSRKEINRVEHARSVGIEPNFDLDPARQANTDRALQTLKFPDELEAIMEKISGDARLAEQEMGLSTLFLAFGFLEWYDSEASDKRCFAPLLLLPVQVQKQKVRGKDIYSLSAREGAAEANLSLQKLLEQNFSRELPEFGAVDEEAIGSIEAYIDLAKNAIGGLKRWQVRRWLVLGHFAFGRFAMYADLKPENWGVPVAHDLVGSILRGVEQTGDPNALRNTPDDYSIDEPEIEKIAPFLIHDADASQHSALVDVMKGKNLVIQGPPGTGKSQTITNIVANALAAGRRVLFLAEKQAALDVVKRRLDRAGLGDFCLELHSDKVSPKVVVQSLKARYELGIGQTLPQAVQRVDSTWVQSREEITAYLRALHAGASDGATAFELIWQALRGRTVHAASLGAFTLVKLPADLLQDADGIAVVTGGVEILADIATAFAANFGHPGRSPWANITFSDFPPYDAPRLLKALAALKVPAEGAIAAMTRHSALGLAEFEDFEALANLDDELGAAPEIGAIIRVASVDLDDLDEALKLRTELLAIEAELLMLPDLRHEEPERLAIANAHMRAPASRAFLDEVPAKAYANAKAIISDLRELSDTVAAALPALRILGLGESIPASQLIASVTGAMIVGMSGGAHRRWVRDLPSASQSAVSAAVARWEPLVEAEREWISLRGYSSANRPRPEDMESAAATLRKAGLSRAIAALTGSVRTARELGMRLGFGNDPSPEDLAALAAHVRAVKDFEVDPELETLFGAAWSGLETPVTDFLGGLRIRDFIRKTILPLKGGDIVVDRLLSNEWEAFAALDALVAACKRVLELSANLKDKLDDTETDRLVSESRKRIATLEAFLAVDPAQTLSGMESTIRRAAHACTLLGRIARMRSALTERATAVEASSLGSSTERIELAQAAIIWVRTIRASAIQNQLKQLLLSPQAAEIREAIHQAAHEWAGIQADSEAAMTLLAEFGAESFAKKPPEKLVPLLDDLLARDQELSAFIALRQHRKRLEAAGLSEFLDCADNHAIEPGRLPGLFGAVVAERRAAAARRVRELANNNGASLDARRRVFAERDLAKIKSDRVTVRARVLAATPPAGSQYGPRKTWTDMKMLDNEFPKMRRFTPVRQLLARGGKAIQALKPCLMMSPLSLAKFVRARSLEFDLLVIDEASQMRPEDALGGMLRAKQIVVVGDAKQLPPTDFFNRAESQRKEGGLDGDEEDDDVNAESILEVCEGTFGERRRLKWHYRSRCESLIAFSNRSFYDDSLITFPMAKPGSFSVELVRVDGIYRTGRNPAEAARIAEEAIAFMRQFADAPGDELPTLGIVAVNVEQRDLIQDEMRRLRADDELVERYCEKAEAKGEPLFVKNLENVQGDERDHIFISLTYGRKLGEPLVAQNFGPITRKQGHRRLNVLFTRARSRVGLFASFGSVDVRPTEMSSEGVHALKRYLEYAETRGRAIVRGIGGEPDSDFELEVADRLRARGYLVDLQVGVSGFRIDLGVRNPDHPEHFLAGIECDGATYHSSKSARDRDRLREEMLKSLGWDLVRVWSTDWFDNPDMETEKLGRKLEELRRRPPPRFETYRSLHPGRVPDTVEVKMDEGDAGVGTSTGATEPESEKPVEHLPPTNGAPAAEISATDLLAGDGPLTQEQAMRALEIFREQVIRLAFADWEAQRSILRPAMIETFLHQRICDPADWYIRIPQYLRSGTNPAEKNHYLQAICDIVQRIGATASIGSLDANEHTAPSQTQSPAPRGISRTSIYVLAEPNRVARPDRERFFDTDYTETLKAMVAHVVEIEAPIFEDLLVDRIARTHSLLRSGNQIRKRVLAALPSGVITSEEFDGRKVIWPSSGPSAVILAYRRAEAGVRDQSDVPLHEVASIAVPFIRLRMEDEAVLRKMAEEFGLGRLREATRARFEEALRIAKTRQS